jgi:multiple sugar transport system permease protein
MTMVSRIRRIWQSEKTYAWLLLLPGAVVLMGIRLWPLLQGISSSFTNRRLLGDRPLRFINVQNYIRAFEDSTYWAAAGYTIVYTLGVVIFSYLLGLVIALLMNMEIKGRGIFRTFLMIPWVIPSVVAAYIWRYALNDQVGIINIMLRGMGLVDRPIPFLATALSAQISTIVVASWKNYPFMGLVLLAGLQNVSHEIKEAARIDGANVFQVFWHVVWPELRGVTAMCTTLMFIWTFNSFDQVFLLTGGGPNFATTLMSILAYQEAFIRQNVGYATSLASLMLLFMLVVTTIYMKIIRGDRY